MVADRHVARWTAYAILRHKLVNHEDRREPYERVIEASKTFFKDTLLTGGSLRLAPPKNCLDYKRYFKDVNTIILSLAIFPFIIPFDILHLSCRYNSLPLFGDTFQKTLTDMRGIGASARKHLAGALAVKGFGLMEGLSGPMR